jgi:hypothetical protein
LTTRVEKAAQKIEMGIQQKGIKKGDSKAMKSEIYVFNCCPLHIDNGF